MEFLSKSLKTDGLGMFLGGSKCFSRGRRMDFDTLQNTRQAQEIAMVSKTLARVVDLKRVRNDAVRVAGAGISCSVMSMFEADNAASVEGLQISCHGSVTLQGPRRAAVAGVRMPRQNVFVAGAILLKHSLKIAKTYCKSEVKRLVEILCLKEVSQKSFVFELRNFIFEGSLAEKLRF